MFGKINEMKAQMEEAKAKLDDIMVHAEIEGGKIRISASASKKIKDISIDPSLLASDQKDTLEDLLVVAIQKCMDEAERVSKEEMKEIAGNLLPGGLGGLGKMFG